jgi:hypothetical protein
MPPFKVTIWGKGLDRTRQALNDAGIKTVGPDRLSGTLWGFRLGRGMTVLVDAATARQAEDRVRDALPDDGYTIGQAKPR